MIINYNATAAQAYNSLSKNTAATSKSIQQLSSGKRINSASDDPAGSAITNLMQNQINGLKQAKLNASSGNDLLQTAADALSNIKDILAEMKTKAVQAASDNNTSADRSKLQNQVDSLAQGISDITNTTEYNTQNLLAGGLSDTFQVGANSNQNVNVSISGMDAYSLGVASYLTAATNVSAGTTTGVSIDSLGRGFAAASGYNIHVTATAATMGDAVKSVSQAYKNGGTLTLGAVSTFTGTVDTTISVKVGSVSTTGATTNVTSITYSDDGGKSWKSLNGNFSAGTGVGNVTIDGVKVKIASVKSGTSTNIAVGDQWNFSLKASYDTVQLRQKTTSGTTDIGAGVNVHYGDTSVTVGDGDSGKTATVKFDYTKLAAGTVGFGVKHVDSAAAVVVNGKVTTNAQVAAGIDISTQASANKAIKIIDDATTKLSEQYAQIGAYQDRLSYTEDNLTSENTNLSTSKSNIENIDISEGTTEYQKNNILQQAATSMLAHANQLPQTALTLLQG